MMPDHDRSREAGARSALRVNAPANRVNVALPFSKFVVEEPSRELAELAAIVAELAAALESAAAGPQVPLLRGRAEALAARVR